MSPFLRAAMARAERDREELLLSMRGALLPYDGEPYDKARAQKEDAEANKQEMRERSETVKRLRAQGLSFPEIAERLSLTWRQVQLAVRR